MVGEFSPAEGHILLAIEIRTRHGVAVSIVCLFIYLKRKGSLLNVRSYGGLEF